jgi:Domain of unknown function (DU1801)
MITETHSASYVDLVSATTGELRAITDVLRDQIYALHPQFVEIIWLRQRIASYGIGPKKMSDHYAYIAIQSKHVNLGFYRGAALNDRDDLLEGAGKLLRHVKVKRLAEARTDAIRNLLIEAIRERLSV